MKNKILFGGICAVIAGCIGMSDVYGGITVIGEIEVPKGEKGDKGDNGTPGAKGDKGDKGDTGADGKSFCDSLTNAQKATTIASSTDWAYVNQNDSTGAVGYKTRTNTMCNGTTKPEVINDECVAVSDTDSLNCADKSFTATPVECKRQIVNTGATSGYAMCKKVEFGTPITTTIKVLKNDISGLITEVGQKANSSELNSYLKTDDLGTKLTSESLKTTLAGAVAGSGALSGYATTSSVNTLITGATKDLATKTELAGKADSDALGSYLKTDDLGTTLASEGLKTTLAGAVAGSGALSGYATTDSVTSSINTAKSDLEGKLATKDSVSAVTTTVNTLSSNLDTAQGKLNTLEGKLSCAGFGKHDITGTDDCPTGYVCTQMLCCETTGDLTNGKCEWKN